MLSSLAWRAPQTPLQPLPEELSSPPSWKSVSKMLGSPARSQLLLGVLGTSCLVGPRCHAAVKCGTGFSNPLTRPRKGKEGAKEPAYRASVSSRAFPAKEGSTLRLRERLSGWNIACLDFHKLRCSPPPTQVSMPSGVAT
ncbi:hypothetical protein P7K49_000675 [Saguinus oedipus]|uniref:Uncharacterized protein n=1 Tax=Saguinus oedipus TaxID=9490 RepID=A0ABQ9WE37_SAGOE|nr:hypothetical protein P7K49_000675 [Saguinus oedipus]